MSVLENPEKLRQDKNLDIRNTPIPLMVFRCDYELRPDRGNFERRTAYNLAESNELAAQLIKNTIRQGLPFVWESMPYQICNIHGITPSLERALYLKLKEKYEGSSLVNKLKRSKK